MLTLWTRMNEIYGHRWAGSFGPFRVRGRISGVAETWRKGLAGLNSADIARGLRECLDTGEAWPPSLPEFRAMCRPRARVPYHKPFPKRLPPPHTPLEQAEKYLAEIYRRLDATAEGGA